MGSHIGLVAISKNVDFCRFLSISVDLVDLWPVDPKMSFERL